MNLQNKGRIGFAKQEAEVAMGEGKQEALRVDFDGQIRLEFNSAKVTSD